jgi:hypothetical protein
MGINMHLPAALAGRRFLQRPRVKGAEIQGSKVDLHVQPLQKVYGDVAPRLERRHVPRRHQGNGFACITAVREQSFGGIHFGSAFGWRARLDGYMMDFSKKSPVWVAPARLSGPDRVAHPMLCARRRQDRWTVVWRQER